jgi:hypothetical protein
MIPQSDIDISRARCKRGFIKVALPYDRMFRQMNQLVRAKYDMNSKPNHS